MVRFENKKTEVPTIETRNESLFGLPRLAGPPSSAGAAVVHEGATGDAPAAPCACTRARTRLRKARSCALMTVRM